MNMTAMRTKIRIPMPKKTISRDFALHFSAKLCYNPLRYVKGGNGTAIQYTPTWIFRIVPTTWAFGKDEVWGGIKRRRILICQ